MADTQTTVKTQPEPTATNGKSSNGAEPEKERRGPKPAVLLVVLVLLIVGGFFGYRYWTFASVHTGSDDAYITSDVVQIAPQVSGSVTQVLVAENDVVKKGQLLVVLDDSTYKANVAQARANVDAAIATAQGAGASVSVTQQTGGANVEQAQGQVSQATSGIAGAQEDVAKSDAAIASAIAQAHGAVSNVATLQAGVLAAQANVGRAAAAVKSAQAQVATSQAGVKTAQAAVDSAQATYDRTARDAQRYANLAAQGAGSRQLADQAATSERAAQASLDATKQQLSAASSTVAARQSDVEAARQNYQAMVAAVGQAKAQVLSARDQVAAANAGVGSAKAAKNAAQQAVFAAQARRQQANGQLSAAQTAPHVLAVSQSAQSQAVAKVEQARAALQQAQIQLNDTRIYAPTDGRVSKKSVEVGNLVQPGAPLMALVPKNDLWVIANLKETQMAGVQPGRDAEIEVDSVPGHKFTGKVQSISPATGATFALLPPDNATGNFTKVVQRIPVKIVLDPGQQDLDRLRAGMSVDATISTQ